MKQKCCFSPTLFKIYLEQALKVLSLADDQVILAQDYEDLEYMTRKLVEEYTK